MRTFLPAEIDEPIIANVYKADVYKGYGRWWIRGLRRTVLTCSIGLSRAATPGCTSS